MTNTMWLISVVAGIVVTLGIVGVNMQSISIVILVAECALLVLIGVRLVAAKRAATAESEA